MIISFFEEFPTKKNLTKLKGVSWETKLYLAAPNIKEFLKLEKDILKEYKQVEEVVFWPTLKISEGYWISPWSDTVALDRLFTELLLEQKRRMKQKLPALSVMLDFEPPKQKRQIVKRFFSFSANRARIVQFLVDYKESEIKLYNIEMSHLPESLVWLLGLGYSAVAFGHTNIAMYYSSFIRPFLGNKIGAWRFARRARKFARRNMIIAIGLIAGGIHKTEPCYSASELEEDLNACSKVDAKEVIIFRLAGMNKEIRKVCEKFV